MKIKDIDRIKKLSDRYNLHEIIEEFQFAGTNEKLLAIAKILNIPDRKVYEKEFSEIVKHEIENIV